MESKAELVTAALLAKGIDPTDTKEWAKEYRGHSRFSRDVLIDVIASYRKKRRS